MFFSLILLLLPLAFAQQTLYQALTQLASGGQLGQLYALVNQDPTFIALLADNTRQYTLFAPTDAAFQQWNPSSAQGQALTTAWLRYHLLGSAIRTGEFPAYSLPTTFLTDPSLVRLPNGVGQVLVVVRELDGQVRIRHGALGSPARVAVGNIMASNGVLHVIDQVLIPPAPLSASLSQLQLTDTLSLLQAFQLTPVLEGLVGMTLFVPEQGSISRLQMQAQSLSTDQWVEWLRYHVLSPTVLYTSSIPQSTAVGLQTATTDETMLMVKVEQGRFQLNEAVDVSQYDILLSNGVMHLVSGFLIPPALNATVQRVCKT